MSAPTGPAEVRASAAIIVAAVIEDGRSLDDVLATGGTIKAIAGLIEELGGSVAKMLFLIELKFLGARKALEAYSVDSLMSY